MVLKCTSCKTNIANESGSVQFPCPSCGETGIIRCPSCRTTAAKYKCHKCSFEGPN